MTIKRYRFIDALLFFILINPIICLLLYAVGIEVNFHSTNILLLFVITILSFITYSNLKSIKVFQIHFVVLVFLMLNILLSLYNPLDISSSIIDLIGYYIQVISPLMIASFFLKEKESIIEKYVLKIGVFIAVLNIIQFLLLVTNNYNLFLGYQNSLGMDGFYVEDLKSLIVKRPAGYFFDIHSQVYMPLFSLILIFKYNLKIWIRNFLFVLIIISIIVSGVKTAYLIAFFILLRRVLTLFNFTLIIRTLIYLSFTTIILNYFLDSIVFELVKRIIIHDLEILFIHLFEVPIFLFNNHLLIFLLGGQVFMENYVYSEVYLITLIFHIGVIGVILYVFIPNLLLFFKGNQIQKDVVLIFVLSLSHYYIFKVGINILGTSLVYVYFLNKFIIKYDS